MKKKNILYLFVTLPIGGAEDHLKTVVSLMPDAGFAPLVCCIGARGAIGEEIEKAGTEVVTLGRKKLRGFDVKLVKDICALIRERDIDIIHTHLYHANMYGRVAALVTGTPVVSTEHNVYKSYKKKRSIINRLLAKKTNRIIAVSGAVKKEIIRRDSIDPTKVEVVYNGIECGRFVPATEAEKAAAKVRLGLASDDLICGTVSRLSVQKGHTYLLKAFKEVSANIKKARLLIVGSGPLETELKSEASSLGLNDSVIFLGARRDVPEILKAFDLYLMPSLWEGLPIALLEAMACALPIVVTDVGGVGEVVEDGVSGVVLEPTDVTGLVSATERLLNDRECAKKMGDNARKVVSERFSAAIMIESMVRIYNVALVGALVGASS